MIKKPFLAFLFAGLFGIGNAMAQTPDSLFQIEQVTDLEEIVVTASPKEYRKLREQPASTTILDEQMLQRHGIDNIKQLNGYIPNLFTPDYGSRMTSAAYIRGIGSRINTPAVGLYVDNLPFIEKSAYDFEYDAIESIDVLRGPQSTLYGRNAMGGLIRIHTKNPFRYQGTDFIIGAASYGGYRASLNTYQRVSSRLAFSAGGFLAHEDGIWRNSYTNGLMDKTDRSGLRFRMLWLPADNLKIGLNSSYEYSDQGGYPYFYRGNLEEETRSSEVGRISVNDPSHYRRHLLNNGITVEYQTNHFTLSAVTGHQYLTDNMLLDQDFTEQDLFTLGQRQQINTLSEEIALKSKSGRRWQWTTGVFGFYQWLNTNAPVAFKKEGLTTLIEDNVNDIFPSSPMAPTMHLTLNNNELAIGDIFRTPTYNLAAYHQSTFNHLFGLQGLSLTLGIRLDYEKMYIDYDSYSQPLDFTFDFAMAGVGPRPPINLT
ncbi:MAG: TonB-dependent receptor plug domain-containing protein, partial [Prevotellaceae bacterium]|nr:TonB-dependent receptor plug domain-containing protein [Prevotellaceae bacterium]